ncbi:phage major capsid protein [Gimesia maris]|uniref:Mu-like prophage major head subunit gpT n=1 Tax=Gimesia maris TaxID=122 RepID=A0ABX5YPR5_9PLAN|nr:hypothetical protein [Gimesia maris]EDL58373.1 hypothetical protein PM8797T_26995 [Gimesia maris DSM 8797]QEG17532.1 hypothetical protein GmarT_34140 [Gimesia maris]QGQ29404.1 hypothetical protein F1729_12450 [Gimesia maris]
MPTYRTEPKTLITLNGGQVDLQAKQAEGLKRFTMTAYTGGPMRLAGFRLPVVVDLAGLQITKQNQPILKDHDSSQIVGHSTEIEKINGELHVAGLVSGSGEAADEVRNTAKNGFPWQASIGAGVTRLESVREGESVTVNGQTFQGPIYVARESVLREVSFVAMGADLNTSAHVEGQFTMPQPTAEKKTLEEIKAQAAEAEGKRIERVKQILSDCPDHIQAKAIEEGWTEQDANEVALINLRASRPKARPKQYLDSARNVDRMHGEMPGAPLPGKSSGHPSKTEVIEASACIEAGMTESEAGQFYDERVMNAAVSREYRGYSIVAIMKDAIALDGGDPNARMSDREFVKAAFTADRNIQASGGFSTFSVPGILGNVANKHLLNGYNAVPTTWRKFCGIAEHKDFKAHSHYRLTGSGEFKPVTKGGEIKHISLKESSYQNQLDTEGAIITLTRQDIINDDMGAFVKLPRILGRMSALKVEETVYILLLSNPNDFFHADNNNYLAGANTALAIESLTAGEMVFLDQVDENGKPILLSPSVLLVPTDLKVTAQQLYADLKVVTGEVATVTDGNPHSGKFEPVPSPHLKSAAFSGSSTKAWYLFNNPADVAALEVAFLNGNQNPIIEHADTDFNTLGMSWRAYHDFGVAMADKKAAFKAKGEA